MVYTKKELFELTESINQLDGNDVNHWVKEFCISDTDDNERIEILENSNPIFNDYDGNYNIFIELINSKRYFNAVRLSRLLALTFPEYKQNAKEVIKNKEFNFVFNDLLMQPGGTGVAVITRANNLVKRGYKINLLSSDDIQDYDEIKKHFYEDYNISKDINFMNMFEYFSKKNTFTSQIKESHIDDENFAVEKTINPDTSVSYDYYKSDDPRRFRTDLFIKDALALRTTHRPFKKEYFTPDGFNYLIRTKINGKDVFYLNDRKLGITRTFESVNHLLAKFIEEYCGMTDDKQFIILDNTSSGFDIFPVNSDESIKIGSIHGNPYHRKGKPEIGPDRSINRNITHFKKLHDYDAFVVLNESMKNDLLKDTTYENFVTIPNLISDEKFEYEPVEKDLRKITMFTRVSDEKNISDAIKAFKIVCDSRDDVLLEIYGRSDQSEKDKLISLIEEFGIEDNIVFKDFISDVALEMKKSLCILMTSFYEGLPMTILESMAYSTPVISYDTNYGPRDIITNNVDGIIVEFGDYEAMANSIIDLLDNPQKAIDMGLKAKEKIRNNYSSDVVCEKWEELFIDLYAKSKIEEYELPFENEDEIKQLKDEIKQLNDEIHSLRKFKREVIDSNSWKLTKPLRDSRKYIKK